MRYPSGKDCVWLASSADGAVGAFITAGEGPIPEGALVSGAIEEVESLVLRDLPVICDATVLAEVPKPDSFQALASRGLFVYDWTDVHRLRSELVGAYELVARPVQPVRVTALPDNLRQLAFPLAQSFEPSIRVDGLCGDD